MGEKTNARNVFIFIFSYLFLFPSRGGIVGVFLVVRVDAISILAVFRFPYGRGGQRCATAAALARPLGGRQIQAVGPTTGHQSRCLLAFLF